MASSLIIKSAPGLMGAVFFAVFLISHINNAVTSYHSPHRPVPHSP